MTDITDLVTIAEFAKEISVSTQTVNTWLTAYNEERDYEFDGEGVISPAVTFGNTRVFSRKQLLELASEKGNSQAIKAAGYVHPDKFKESEDARIRLSAENAEQQARIDYLVGENDRLGSLLAD